MLFLNGLPVVVIECKSPKVKDAIPEAIDQLLRYSEQRGAKGEGNAPLFYYCQFVVATCRQEAKFGTITTHTEKYFYRWADPYPRTVDELDHGSGSPNDQQRLVAGMLDRDNLLDLIRTFTLFSTNDKGQTIKIVGRYQQFRAVKLAVKRLLEGRNPRERSGIIWHTQGSGKSLTMMFMVREMYRHAQLSNWKVVFITDRTQLEQQLSETSQSIGFTVKLAGSIKGLKKLLSADTSDLVMAMIHKFREADLTETFPELNSSPNILVMTDEAHRSQYKLLGANLDKGIPNAAKIGYTGTPIDKTEQVFGDYIDKYTMRQSIEDGVTLEIVYEGRTHNAEVPDQGGMDAAFEDIFSDYNIQQRLDILGYGSRDAYLEADPTIEGKAQDMVEHYLAHVFPNGYKAQVVATSREAAVRYKKHLDTALAAAVAKLEPANTVKQDLDSVVAWIGAEMEFARSQAVASGDAFEPRPPECGHCVQNFLADLDLRDLPGEAARFELGADHALPTTDLRFYPAALVVPCGHLPGHAAVAADLGNMAIPNGWIPRRLRSDHCVLRRRYNHIQGLPIPLPQQIPYRRSIIGAVSQKARDRSIELIQEPG